MYVSMENTPLGAAHECMNDSKNDLMKFWVTNNVITDQAQYVAVTAVKMVLRSAASSTDVITARLKGKKCAVALLFFLACFLHC